MVVRLPAAQKREFLLQTVQRILKFEPGKSKLSEEGHVIKHVFANSPHLSHQEKTYVKNLCHLLIHGPFTKNLYNSKFFDPVTLGSTYNRLRRLHREHTFNRTRLCMCQL